MRNLIPTAQHWGVGFAEVEGDRLIGIHPHPQDPTPSPLVAAAAEAAQSAARVQRPAIRESFLKHGIKATGAGRGAEPFISVPWDEALDIAAREIERVRTCHGNDAIFAGSYGWASAGRFHHAQSQVHRFMRAAGGYIDSVDNYSFAAALVIAPHVVGPLRELIRNSTVWPVLRDHGDLVVMFGGVPLGNTQIAGGGVTQHRIRPLMAECRKAGLSFINISPDRSDAAPELEAEWIAPRPNTDTALMLGLAHTLVTENLHNQAFLDRYTVGFDQMRAYLLGHEDGQAKHAEWAAAITGLPADQIRALARRMAATRCMILCAASLQRADHDDQPFWMSIVLAAVLGQIGLPGGGFGFGYGSDGIIGAPVLDMSWPALPQGRNAVDRFIPVARISDMLLNPGAQFSYNGKDYTYPHVRLVYWAGGNPFHHHQDLNRLVEAFRQPESIIVNEIFWTATARHADIVLPATTPLERNDLCISRHDHHMLAMKQAIPPVGEARDDYAIFSSLSERLGCAETFTEGLDEIGWLRRLWQGAVAAAADKGDTLPEFDQFWETGETTLPPPSEDQVLLKEFRSDPDANPLPTPSGRIEIFSQTVAGFEYDDCPGHPVWLEPYEWLGAAETQTYPLHLITPQPRTRLHSQLDNGTESLKSKIKGREPLLMHPDDAVKRGLEDGDIVEVYNDRGSCLAGLRLSSDLAPNVIKLATGAWYDPECPGQTGTRDKHGNPNILTKDAPTSKMSQATTAQTVLVEVRPVTQQVPPVSAFEPSH